MKCEDLIKYKAWELLPEEKVCLAVEVYKAIAELKAENESLKAKLESVQASAYTDSVDAGMRERRLKRALYKACANWAHAEFLWARFIDFKFPETWYEMENKCLKKAEEYR